MKQTAVEWLYKNLKSHFKHDGDLLEVVQMSFEQAKEMEKEQMVNFTDNYVDNCVIPNENMAIPTIMDMPNYYSKKYGKPFIDLVSDEESKVHEVVRKLKEKRIK